MLFVERKFSGNFEDIMDGLQSHFKNGGFVTVSDTDVSGMLKKTLNFDFKKYHILGVCTPQGARDLIGGNDINGFFLPCKVVAFYEAGETTVRLMKSSEVAKKFYKENAPGIRKYEDELVELLNSFSP